MNDIIIVLGSFIFLWLLIRTLYVAFNDFTGKISFKLIDDINKSNLL